MTVVTTFQHHIALIELNRPEAMNALNEQMLADLNAALDEVESSTCRGMVFTGAGDRAFCAGADISQLQGRTPRAHRANAVLGQAVFDRVYRSPLPSVAVIHGFAFGGGLELALACTARIATSRAKMGLPEVKLGLIPGYGGTQRLPRLIGEARAAEIILGGEVLGAEEALHIGLINRIVDGGRPGELGIAYLAPWVRHGKVAVAAARQAMRRGQEVSLNAGLAIEADVFSACTQSRDAAEGIAAFLAKRPAVFRDE
ncbi:3-hydroxybutyryl-CoA dehydratase [Bordetella sputigena]|uniref:enoyl-CoA hydratase/isomerase family protein n=1 Tax=Bordetella sputigena TaxID=1416810 RepID=UPI0039EEDB17